MLPGKFTDIARLVYVRNRVCGKIDELRPDIVVMEDLSFGSKGQAVHDQAGLSKMIQAEFFGDKLPYALIAPSSLKKFCCGSAGSPKNPVKKEHVLRDLALRFGHNVNDNNVADAIVLAYIGMTLMGEYEPTLQAQRDSLIKIRERNPGIGKAVVQLRRDPEEW